MIEERIKNLTAINGNVGYEDAVIHYVLKELKDIESQISIDSIGNITIHLTPNNVGSRKVMYFAHMDEVGMMVRKIDKDGFVYVEKLGSVNPTTLQGATVELHTKKGIVYGVFGTKSHHYLSAADKVNRCPLTDMYIDIGANSKESAIEAGVSVGTPITYVRAFKKMLDGKLCNKAMDDRALIAILLELIQRTQFKNVESDVYFVLSVQEEFNTRGIMPTVREIKPNIVIGLDITPACDTPELKYYSDVQLGKGPAITYMNHHSRGTLAGLVTNQSFLTFIEEVANDNQIPMQKEVATGILTETAYISIENVNTVVTNIGLPTRYTHTPMEIIDMHDVEQLTSLLEKLLYAFNDRGEFGKNIDVKREGDNE